jgi:hypothetical protein
MRDAVLVGVGAGLEVLPELALLLVAGCPVVIIHHSHHTLREVVGASEEVHLSLCITLIKLS